MSIKRLAWVVPLFFVLSVASKADAIASIYFNGGYAFGDNGYGIPPYQGTLDGQAAQFYCVDFAHDITVNSSWQATVTDISNTSDYSSTRLDNGTIYSEITWLLDQSQATTDQSTQAEFQWAVWSFSGGGNPYGTNSQWITLASTAVADGFSDNSWEILTPTGNYGQEFVVKTPEPSSLLLVSLGLVGLAVAGRRQRIA